MNEPTSTTDNTLIRRAEELRVTTERVVTERVVIRKRIEVEERTITVPVRREVVEIVREPVTTGGGQAPHRPAEVTEVIVRAEEPLVSLEVVDVGRVRVLPQVVRTNVEIEQAVAHEVIEADGAEAPARDRRR